MSKVVIEQDMSRELWRLSSKELSSDVCWGNVEVSRACEMRTDRRGSQSPGLLSKSPSYRGILWYTLFASCVCYDDLNFDGCSHFQF